MVTEINQSEFEEKIKERCVVDFYATWCPPCKMLAPVIDELSEEMKDIPFYKINVDENLKISEEYGIMHVPTVIVFENGETKNRVSGFIDKEQLKKFINA